MTSERTLFNALRIQLPPSFRDISDLVPIPDNQEVFQDMSAPSTGKLIIELTELCSKDNLASYHFQDLVEANGATNFAVTKEFKASSSKGHVCGVIGTQTIKGEMVTVRLCVLSLPEYKTDILVHLGTTEQGHDEATLD